MEQASRSEGKIALATGGSRGLGRNTVLSLAVRGCVRSLPIEVVTRYLAKELGARGIAVNTVAPRTIATDL